MSRKRQNHHYHYAEKFTGCRRRAKRFALPLPSRTVFFALLVLLIFGAVTATFSLENPEPATVEGGAMIIRIRNPKVSEDTAVTLSKEGNFAPTGAEIELAEVGGMTDLLYNSATAGWGTNSSIACNSNGWISLRFTSDTNNETFKVYHKGWTDAYFSKSAAAVSLNTEYTLNNTGSNPNMTFSFVKNAYYGMKIKNPDAYNDMKMTLYRLFDANSVFYIDVSDYWSDDDPEIGGYFCDSTSNTATWVRATRCADVSNSHLYRLVAPNSNIYSKLVLGRFQNGTTASQMSFSGSRFYNQSVDIYYQASNTKIKLTSYGSGSSTPATVSTSSITHTHKYYAYEYTRDTTSDSYALAATVANNTSVSCGTATISLTASDRSSSGYEFDGWYRGTTANVNNATTLVSSNLSCTPTNYSGTSYYYAKYTLSSYTITYHSDGSPATASAGSITNPAANSVPSSEEKAYDVAYTITSNTFSRQHYTQVGWATTANYTSQTSSGVTTYYALGANYATNGDLDLYPVWQLDTPTASITKSGDMTVGSTPVTLTLSQSGKSDDVVRSYSFAWTGSTGTSGATVTLGTDPTDAVNFMKFSADTPGVYNVTVTVTDVSNTGVTNTSNTASVTTAALSITVSPSAPVFKLTVNGVADDGRDGETQYTAYKILLGTRYYCSAAIDSTYLTSHPLASYTYEWATDAEFMNIINKDSNQQLVNTDAISFTNVYVSNSSPKAFTVTLIDNSLVTYNPSSPPTPDPRTLAEYSNGWESVTIYCRVTCNTAASSSRMGRKYYFIQPLIESFVYEPMQKIFNINDQTVTLAAEYNIPNDDRYTTKLKFSHDNHTYEEALSSSGFIPSFINAIRSYMYPCGPKYFYLWMYGPNAQNEYIESKSDTIHTTVGTSDSIAARVLYFENVTNTSLKDYLVMCYYIDGSGNLCYQAAQDLQKDDVDNAGYHYRVMLPSNATAVCFGFLKSDLDGIYFYGSPSLTAGAIDVSSFSSDIFYGYTNSITLTDSVCKITANSKTDTGGGFMSFSCTAGAY